MNPEALLIILIVNYGTDFSLVTQRVTFSEYRIVRACKVLPEIDIANASYGDVGSSPRLSFREP